MTSESATLDRVLKGQLCTGCGLCASIAGPAVEMQTVAPGYSRPRQVAPISSEAERVISSTCPGAVAAPWAEAPNVDPYWGPWREVLTGHALDERVRYEGSSGGVLSALLIHALETDLIDRVVHVEADRGDPTRNIVTCSRTPSEVLAGAGSRYTASSPLESIDEALKQGGAFAFVGKPCDVSALRLLARTDARVDRHVALVLSFFCGGMPSHDGVLRILAAMGTTIDEVTAFRFRGQGWPGTAAATLRNGDVRQMSYADSWGGYLSKQVQFRCKICPDAVGGVADIACADAWYGDESGYPSFDEGEGRSLIIARSAIGDTLLKSAVAAEAVRTEALDIAEIEKMQPAQASRKRMVRARVGALLATFQPRPRMRGLKVDEAARAAGARDQLRNLLGTARRILERRR